MPDSFGPLCILPLNPKKCTTVRITRSRRPITRKYNIRGEILQEEIASKYLGIFIHSKLEWGFHIDKVVKKANSSLGFLRRNLNIRNKHTKDQAYITLVRPIMEYAAEIWNPYKADHVRKLEAVQRRAARYVTGRHHNTSSVSCMLQDLGWETLEKRRLRLQLTFLYKIINNLVDIDADKYLQPTNARTRSSHSLSFKIHSSRTDYYKYSFFPRTVCNWNTLPATVAEAPDLVSFKRELTKFDIRD